MNTNYLYGKEVEYIIYGGDRGVEKAYASIYGIRFASNLVYAFTAVSYTHLVFVRDANSKNGTFVNGEKIPVSYTHLDVYKRQAAHRPPKARIEALRTSFICRESGAVSTSVSYTHLVGGKWKHWHDQCSSYYGSKRRCAYLCRRFIKGIYSDTFGALCFLSEHGVFTGNDLSYDFGDWSWCCNWT